MKIAFVPVADFLDGEFSCLEKVAFEVHIAIEFCGIEGAVEAINMAQ